MSSNKETAVPEIVIPTIGDMVEVWQKLIKDSIFFANKCRKPDRKEFIALVYACSTGFAVIGFIGAFVRLFFIPVNKFLIHD